MWIETLAPSAVAIVVPWLAFQYALRQDRQRWSRERRAEVYIDLLVEVSAERYWLARQLTLEEGLTPEDLSPFEDHRLNDLDRRRLGARSSRTAAKRCSAATTPSPPWVPGR